MRRFRQKRRLKTIAAATSAALLLALILTVTLSAFETPGELKTLALSSLPDGQSPSRDGSTVYTIGSAAELKRLSELVAAGDSMEGAEFHLGADIVLNEGDFNAVGVWSGRGTPEQWTPIGEPATPFSGSFYGNGNAIYGLYVERDGGPVGLFGNIRDAHISGLTIKNSYFSGLYYVGGIAGYAVSLGGASIKDCRVEAYLNCANDFSGMIAGYAAGMGESPLIVKDCLTAEGIRQLGVTNGKVELSGDEYFSVPGSDGSGIWLWITLALLAAVVIASVIILLFKKGKKGREPEKNQVNPEPETLSEPIETPEAEESVDKEKPAEAEESVDKEKLAEAEEPDKSDESAGTAETEKMNKNDAEENADAEAADAVPPEEIAAPSPKETDGGALGDEGAAIADPPKPPPIGYYYIKKTSNNGFIFNLKAANHETIATSETYSALSGCKNGIQSVAKNAPAAGLELIGREGSKSVPAPKFEVYTDKGEKFRFRLKAGNHEIIAVSQGYTTLHSCKNGIESVRRNSASTRVIIEDRETGKRREQLRAEIIKAERVSVEEADSLIDDEAAGLLVEGATEADENLDALPMSEIFTDTLGESFDGGDKVNLAALIARGLLPPGATRLRVLARGSLDKALHVEADDFSPTAVKMIVLSGGKASRAAE